MRTLMMGLLLTTALPAFADTFELDTDVTAALITGNGGVVTYTSEVALTPGRHTLVSFLPVAGYRDAVLDTRIGDPASVRIVAQSTTTEFAKPIKRLQSDQEVAAQNAFEDAQRARRVHGEKMDIKDADLKAATTQLNLIKITSNTGFGTPEAGINAEQVIAVTTALGELLKTATVNYTKAKTEYTEMVYEMRRLDEDVKFTKSVWDSLKPENHVDLVQVTTQIEVSAAQTAKVEFDNLEPAYWSPAYKAELTQDGAEGKLLLHRKATVQVGRAGVKPLDAWDAVDITLSTANLSDRTDTRIPWPDIQTLIDESRLQKRKSINGASYSRMASDAEEPVVESVELYEESPNSTSFAGQTLLFTIGGKSSIDWSTESSSFNIDTLSFDVDLYAMANAATEKNAFLYTDLKNDTGGVLLSGPVKLHRDGTLIGNTYLPQLVPNQDEPVGLGPLYGVQIKRDTLSVEEGDSGFISSKSEINREYRTTIISSLSYDMPTKLLDVIPTSENEDLVIRMNASPRPTDENRKGKRGVLVWDMDLGAGDTEVVTFGYQMKWPSGQVPVQK